MASNWDEYIENQKILRENLKQNPHIKFSNPKNRILYPEEYEQYKLKMQVAENNKKYGHTQGVIKSADPTKPYVAKMINRQNALEFAKKHPKIDKLLHFIPLVNLAWTDMKADPDAPSERKAVAQAAVTDALSLAGLGKVVKSAGVIPAVTAEAAGIAGAYGGSEAGEYLVQKYGAPEWTPIATTIIGGGIGGGFGYKLPGKFVERGIFPDKAVQKGLYSAEYVKAPLTRMFDNQTKIISPETYLVTSAKTAAVPTAPIIDVKDTYGHAYKKYKPLISWDVDHRAKISEGERLGLPKSERVVETPEYLELKKVYNDFADTYGYPRTRAKTYEELVRDSRKIINRHNTFLRGVGMSDELIEATPGMTDEKRLIYAATQPNVDGDRIWVSPGTDNAFSYGNRDPRKAFAVRLPIHFEGDPKTWFKKYYPIKEESPYTLDDIIVAPWGSETNNEYLVRGPLTSIFSTSVDEAYDKIPATLVTRRSGHGFLTLRDKQWDDAYFRALARGDIEKAQFLRDLHFHDASIQNRLISGQKPIKLYHNTDKSFTEFDLSKIGTNNDPGFYGHGIYTSPDSKYSSTYGPKQMVLYGNLIDPFVTNGDLVKSAQSYNFGRSFDYTLVDIPIKTRIKLESADGVIHTGPSYLRGGQPIEEVVFSKPSQLKLADVITYDDAGNIIPLSQRDNFEIKDLRYVAFPAAAVGGGISLIKNNSTQNGK